MTVPPVMAFESGTNRWLSLQQWPQVSEPQPLYLRPAGQLSFTRAELVKGAAGFDMLCIGSGQAGAEYLPRPIHIEDDAGEKSWQTWLVSDQRPAASRPDVLTYQSDVLTRPLKLSGEPIANLIAATSGSDGDFVVKLIDVYPDEQGGESAMGGYQLMIAVDILRGRYRNAYDRPEPIPANRKQTYRFALPPVNHVFLPGHRLMVQVQSTLFPVYDRNPQTYVPNIFFAKPADYVKATIKVFETGRDASFVQLPVVANGAPDGP